MILAIAAEFWSGVAASIVAAGIVAVLGWTVRPIPRFLKKWWFPELSDFSNRLKALEDARPDSDFGERIALEKRVKTLESTAIKPQPGKYYQTAFGVLVRTVDGRVGQGSVYCPNCRNTLSLLPDSFTCTNKGCGWRNINFSIHGSIENNKDSAIREIEKRLKDDPDAKSDFVVEDASE